MKTLVGVACVVLASACSSATGTESGSDAPPTLEILTPERGALDDAGQVTVTGHVQDDAPGVRVTLNGVEVTVENDGSFTSTIQVPPGIAILETHAIDKSNHDVRDVRAVLAGNLAPSDGKTASKIGARLGRAGIRTVGNALATSAEAIDFTAAATAMNPIYDNGGCLGAKIDITSVDVGNINVVLVPKAGALDTSVELDNVVVRMHANFKVACIGGSTTITVRSSKATVRDDLGVLLVTGKIRTSLPSPTVELAGFSIDVGGVPGAIENLLKDRARAGAESAIANAIKSKVPAIADAKLSTLLAKPLDTQLVGHDLAIGITPTNLEVTTTGMSLTADSTLVIAGGEGGTFLSTPMPINAIEQDGANLGVLIADDLVNQLFAGMWAAGAFDLTLSAEAAGPVAALLDDDVRTIDLKLSLPPTVTTRDALELAVGDLIITGRDGAGVEVQSFALSLKTTLVATPSGSHLALTTTTPTVFAQVLAQSAAVDNPLEDGQIEGIVTGVWGLVDGMLNDALVKLPMPSVAGINLAAPAITGKSGYLVLDADLQ